MTLRVPVRVSLGAAAFAGLAGCVFALQVGTIWPYLPAPGTGLDPELAIGPSEVWAVRKSRGNPYTYLQCVDNAGAELGHIKMKAPYAYEKFGIGPILPDGGDVWAVVTYPSSSAPDYVWMEKIDYACRHKTWVTVPDILPDIKGRNTGVAVGADNRVYIASTVGSNASMLHYLQSYDPATGVWNGPQLLGIAALPGELASDSRLRYDAATDLLAYGDRWQYTIDPDTLLEIGVRELEVPSGYSIRDWDIEDDYTVALLRNTLTTDVKRLDLYGPGGALEHSDDTLIDSGNALATGAPKAGASPPYLPVFLWGTIPGSNGWAISDLHLELVSL